MFVTFKNLIIALFYTYINLLVSIKKLTHCKILLPHRCILINSWLATYIEYICII